MKYSTLRRGGLLLVATLLLSFFAQSCTKDSPVQQQNTTTQTISGVIMDEQGHAVPEATLDVRNVSDVQVATTITDSVGGFILKDVVGDPSQLTIHVTREGLVAFTTTLATIVKNAGASTGILLKVQNALECCGVIHLSVMHGDSGLANAEVRLRKNDHLVSTGHTNGDGSISFSSLCAGTYNVRIAKNGFTVVEQNIGLDSCQEKSVTISMQGTEHNDCCQGVLTILPKDHEGHVLSGASIRISKGSDIRNVTSTADGYTFHEVCEGSWAVRIAKEGYQVVEFSTTMECNHTMTVDRTLEAVSTTDTCCNGRVLIIPKNSNNEILVGATVKLWFGNHLLATTTANSHGAVFEGLCSGNYSADITKDGYNHKEFSFELSCNQNREISQTLDHVASHDDSCCHGVIHVNVSAGGHVLQGATVKLWKNGTLVETGTTTDGGNVGFDGLCTGTYAISITKEGYVGQEQGSIVVECNHTVNLTKTLEAVVVHDTCCSGIVRVTVQHEGTALAGATVKLWKGSTLVATTTTTDGGLAVFEHLCEGDGYSISVTKEGYTGQESDHFTVSCAHATEITKSLAATQQTCCTAIFHPRVRVAETDAEWLQGVTVTVKKGDDVVATGTTTDGGYFTAEHLCQGQTYTITFTKDGYTTKTVTITFQSCYTMNEIYGLVHH